MWSKKSPSKKLDTKSRSSVSAFSIPGYYSRGSEVTHPIKKDQMLPKPAPMRARLLGSQAVAATPEFARRYLAGLEFDGERQINHPHVDFLAEQMLEDRFNWSIVVIATAEYQGRTYRINGQHTMTALLDLNPDNPPVVLYQNYFCDSVDDLKSLYSSFDRGKPRTNTHLNQVELAGTAISKLVSKRMLPLLGGAYDFWLGTWSNPAQRGLIVQKYFDLSARLGAFDANRQAAAYAFYKRQPIVAAMLATFARNMTDARSDAAVDQFWADITEGDHLESGTAKKSLRIYLSDHFLNASINKAKKSTAHKVVPPEEMFCICIRGWNYHCQGRDILPQHFRPGSSRPEVVRYSDVVAAPQEKELIEA